jgi:cell division protein FtsB
MGLFDKRDRRKRISRNEFDSPVEQIDLSSASGPIALPEPETKPVQAELPVEKTAVREAAAKNEATEPDSQPTAQPDSQPTAQPDSQPTAQPDSQPTAPAARVPAYGIDNAIELMRSLPSDNIELVVKVVKHTLESLQIRTADIIHDAIAKQESIEARLKQLRAEIADYESEIASRQKEIEKLNGEYKETNTVRKHLELAENLCKNGSGKRTGIASSRAASPAPGAAATHGAPKGSDKPANRASNPPFLGQSPAKK